MAEQVLRMPAPTCACGGGCPRCRAATGNPGRRIQTKAYTDGLAIARPVSAERVGQGAGEPLPDGERAFFEPRFGVDLHHVRIHRDQSVVQTSRRLGAKAFTQGADIYFGAGMFDAATSRGRRLIAHELTHVVQQGGGNGPGRGNAAVEVSRAPTPLIQRAIQDVQQAELITFLSQPEPQLPQGLLDKYLLEPGLMATQRAVIADLATRVQSGDAPLTTDQLLALVQQRERDRGSAYIICHNVTKALARGQSPINWSNVSRSPLVYSLNGTSYRFDPAQFHHDAYAYGSRGQETVFYAMLSGDQLGMQDEGGWYHYFAIASVAYYRAGRRLVPDVASQQDALTQLTGGAVRQVAAALRDGSVRRSAAYDGWLLANATSFLEGGFYGRNQSDVDQESSIHVQGAGNGLAAIGRIPEEGWRWSVPAAGSIRPTDLSGFQLRPGMIARTLTSVDGRFDLTIVSAMAPDHWYDTPDLFVREPGFLGGRTTTKANDASPVWNERLTTLGYGSLPSVSLELIDEDVAFNDRVATFTADLRPGGRRTRRFTLSSSGATLTVTVSAVGDVVLA